MTKEYQTLDFADVNNIVGVDLGINFLATTYDSQGKTTFYNGNIVKHKRGKFKATRKQLQTRQTPSSRKKIKQIGSRENRYVTDVNHQITKALVEAYPRGTYVCFRRLNRGSFCDRESTSEKPLCFCILGFLSVPSNA